MASGPAASQSQSTKERPKLLLYWGRRLLYAVFLVLTVAAILLGAAVLAGLGWELHRPVLESVEDQVNSRLAEERQITLATEPRGLFEPPEDRHGLGFLVGETQPASDLEFHLDFEAAEGVLGGGRDQVTVRARYVFEVNRSDLLFALLLDGSPESATAALAEGMLGAVRVNERRMRFGSPALTWV